MAQIRGESVIGEAVRSSFGAIIISGAAVGGLVTASVATSKIANGKSTAARAGRTTLGIKAGGCECYRAYF